MSYFKIGSKVEVNKDIFRTEEVNPEKDDAKVKSISLALDSLSEALGVDKEKIVSALEYRGLMGWSSAMYFSEKTDSLQFVRGISRRETLYASSGETGVVKELFRPDGTGGMEVKPWYAKVAMDNGGIKTFRLTSLNHSRVLTKNG
jgi:hypothetical protein